MNVKKLSTTTGTKGTLGALAGAGAGLFCAFCLGVLGGALGIGLGGLLGGAGGALLGGVVVVLGSLVLRRARRARQAEDCCTPLSSEAPTSERARTP